jgi:hypothetical protein
MNKKETNRALQRGISKEFVKGVKLIDVDTTIAEYMIDTIIPDVEEHGNKVKVPLLYGNAERWNNARAKGYLRDQRGKIQIPLVMFKRNSIERDSNLAQFKDVNTLPAYKKYSSKNRYERFSLQSNAGPSFEQYEVSVPDYVTVSYEVMIWTSFTEHMNTIVEAFQYATDRYWGKEDGFKFRTRIDSFDNQQEVGEGSERIIRTSFTMVVNAYLLPETYDEKPTVRKSFTPKKVVWGIETDLTGQTFTNPNIYNEYQNVIDFVAIRGSKDAVINKSSYPDESADGVTNKYSYFYLENVELPILPQELVGTFDTRGWFRIYINGVYITPTAYTYTFNGTQNRILFKLDNTQAFESGGGLTYILEPDFEVSVTGKFIEL